PNGDVMIYHSSPETLGIPRGLCPTSQRLSLSRHAESVTSFDGENRNCDLPMSQPKSRRRSVYSPQERGEIVETRKPIPEVLQSRRYATDFGLGRYDVQPSPLPPVPPPYLPRSSSTHRGDSNVSSTGSTPSSQDPETDSSLSLYEDFSLEFPQPPPIRSPVLRRMKSSPWLTGQRTKAVEKHPIQQSANIRLTSSVQRNSQPCFSPSTSDLKYAFIVDFEEMAEGQIHNPDHKDLDLEMVGEALVGLEMNSFVSESSIQGISDEVGNSTIAGTVISAGAELLRWSTLHRVTPPLATRTSISPVNRPLTNSQDENTQVSDNSDPRSRPPQTIRKVASMREQSKDSELTTIIAHRPLPKIKSLRFIPPPHWDHTPTSASNKEAKCGTALARPPPGANRRGTLNGAEAERSLPKTPYPSSTINGATQKLSHRQHQSVPLAGLGFSDAALFKCQASRPQPLAAPFSYRPSLSVTTQGYKEGALPTPKSFIDITPERATAPVALRKERVKRFIARASNGVKNWSRQFAKKTQSSG
ncbi:uncharacterized protein LACBIDRAFT_324016, partial [Laccaria bicolor S238N-H82]